MRMPRLSRSGPLGAHRLQITPSGRSQPGCVVQLVEAAVMMALGVVGAFVMALVYALAAAGPVMIGVGVLHPLAPAVPAVGFAATYALLVAGRLALAMVNSTLRIAQPTTAQPTTARPTTGQNTSADGPT